MRGYCQVIVVRLTVTRMIILRQLTSRLFTCTAHLLRKRRGRLAAARTRHWLLANRLLLGMPILGAPLSSQVCGALLASSVAVPRTETNAISVKVLVKARLASVSLLAIQIVAGW